MRNLFLVTFLILLISTNLSAQIDTLQTNNLLDEISANDKNTDSIKLLPDKILITQRIFWGKRGLMRNFDRFELTPLKRQEELKNRRVMLVSHQALGFLTLGGMIAQGIVGFKLYNGDTNLRGAHEALAVGVNVAYFTTASLAMFSPPKMMNERKGFSSIKIHKALAIIHLSGMIATNILASQLEGNPNLRPYHRAAAITSFVALEAAMIVIKF